MLAKRARHQLQAHRELLARWHSDVPERAKRFHGARIDLDRQVADALGRWWQPWVNGDELARIGDQVSRLEGVAGGLTTLVHSAQRLEEETRRLEERSAAIGDSDIASWLARQARDWLIRIERIGGNCDRLPELFHDEQILAEIEASLRLHDEAVYWLTESDEVFDVLDSDPAADELRADLPGLKRELVRSGASPQWIEGLRKQLEPLKERAEIIRDPPPELRQLSEVLKEVRGWSRQLGESQAELRELEQNRHHFVAVEWRDDQKAEVRQVATRAEKVRNALLTTARDIRRSQLAELEQGILDLFQACGQQPGLEKDLAELEKSHQKVQRHHQHSEWLRRFGRARDRFQGIAETKQLDLEARLRKRSATLRQGLEALRGQPLSDEVHRRADQLEHQVGEFSRHSGVEQILSSLRKTADLEQDLADLDLQARQDIQDLAAAQTELREHNTELREQATTLELDMPDLASHVEALAAGTEKLEAARQSADRLRAELDGQRQQLIAHCQQLLNRRRREIRDATDALRLAGQTLEEPIDTKLPDDAAPSVATAAVAALDELAAGLRARADDAIGPLDERRRHLSKELGALPIEELSPGDREDAEQLIVELENGSWSLVEDPLERLRLLAFLVQKCELLFHRLKQDQFEAESLLADLQRRLRNFNENQLRRYCPELTDRATALIYGAPAQPSQWLAVRHQLHLAATLLGRLEHQATRLAARDVERASAILRRRLRDTEGEPRRAAEKLLAELDDCRHDRVPPVTLRMRLLNAVPRNGER